jgi:sugar lactone lactonase YvrE
MKTLLSDLGLVESPRWHDGRLWFADWIAGTIIALDPSGIDASGSGSGSGSPEVMIEHRSLPLCFDFLADGTPIVVSGPGQALLRAAADGTLSTYADLSAFSPFGGGNDIVIDGRDNAYVDNPNYDAKSGAAPIGEVAPGFIALVTPDGSARIVADDLAFPNGIVVSADNSTLVVAESHRGRLTAFDIAADGSLGGRRVWAELGDGAPDGICFDADGAIWYADVPNKHCVRVAEGGAVLDTVEVDRGCFACMLGGTGGDTLFVVAAQWHGMASLQGEVPWEGQVLSTPAPARGAGWPRTLRP